MPKLRLDGDATASIRAVEALHKAQDELVKGGKEVEKQFDKLSKEAQRIREGVDPMAKYNRQLERLAFLIQKGKLSTEDAHKAAIKYEQQLRRTGQASEESFGEKAIGNLAGIAAGWFSVSAAVGAVTDAYQAVDQAGKQAAQNSLSSMLAIGEIAQIASTPEKAQSIKSFGDELLRKGIFSADQGDQAYKMAFDVENAKYTDSEKQMLLRIGDKGVVRPEGLLGLAGDLRKYQEIFGEKQTGSLENILDKAVVASGDTMASLSQVVSKVPAFAGEAKRMGLSDEETLASFVAVEKRSENTDIAATHMKNLLGFINKNELAVNSDLTQTMAAINKRVASGESLSKIIPDAQARAAATDIMASLGYIANLEKGIAGAPGAMSRQENIMFEADPTFKAGKLNTRAKGELATTERELYAERQLLFELVSTRQQERNLRIGVGPAGQWLDRQNANFADLFGMEQGVLERQMRIYENDRQLSPLTAEDANAIKGYLQRIAESQERSERKKPKVVGRER